MAADTSFLDHADPPGAADGHADARGDPRSGRGAHRPARHRPRLGKLVACLVVAAWIGILVFMAPLGIKLSTVQRDAVTDYLPATAESTRVAVAAAALPGGDVRDALVLYQRPAGITPDDRATATRHLATLSARYASAGGQVVTSRDGAAALFHLSVSSRYGDTNTIVTAIRAVVAAHPPGLTVTVTGPAAVDADLGKVFQSVDVKLLLATVAVVAVLLVLTYRGPVLWIVPLIAVGCAVLLSMAMVYLLVKALGVAVSTQTASILRVLVFGTGTDYALLLVARYREELRKHPEPTAAMAHALRRAAPAIVASGGTVIAGLLCLLAADMNSLRGLGPVAATGVACALLVMTTLFPALVVILGRPVFWPAIPRPGSAPPKAGQGWYRLGRAIARHWVLAATLATLALGVLASGLHTHLDDLHDADRFTKAPDSVVALPVIARVFPDYAGRPLTVLARAPYRDEVLAAVRTTGGIERAVPGRTGNGLVEITAIPTATPDSPAERDTIVRVRDRVHAIAGAGAIVGGQSAQNLDQTTATRHDRNLVIPLILVVVLIVLNLLLRAVVAAVVLVATVVLSFAAALGTSLFVFTHLFGFKGLDPTVPVLGFMFLVALGVDYNIFLMTRAREEVARTGPREGMMTALATTGGVVTSAGVVLAATFAVLAMLPVVVLVQVGFLVAFGVILDTMLVRSVLVPALAFGLGRVTWWPGLPRRQPTGTAGSGPTPVARPPERVLDSERVHIARDLHGVIAEAIAAINTHVDAAEQLLAAGTPPGEPVLDRLTDTIRHIGDITRSGLAELRATAPLLDGYQAPRNGPLPDLPDLRGLDELARPLRSAGIEVEIDVVSASPWIPRVVEAAVYRVVEAALADTLRDKRVRRVLVRVLRDRDALRVMVLDDGVEVDATNPGLAARTAVLGGQLVAGRYQNAHRVEAVLPLPPALTATAKNRP